MTSSEYSKQFAKTLKAYFPELGTKKEMEGGDTVEALCSLYSIARRGANLKGAPDNEEARPRSSSGLIDYVETVLGIGEICSRCHAHLNTFADTCTAGLDDPCPGFLAIEAAKERFNRARPRTAPPGSAP